MLAVAPLLLREGGRRAAARSCLFSLVIIALLCAHATAADEAKNSDAAKVDRALKAKKAAVHAISKALHKQVSKEPAAKEPKKFSNWPGERVETQVHHDATHAQIGGSDEGSHKAAAAVRAAASEQAHKAHEQHHTQKAKAAQVLSGKNSHEEEESKTVAGKHAVETDKNEKKEVDPRLTNRGKFGWLFKAAEKDADVKKASKHTIQLQGGDNATEESAPAEEEEGGGAKEKEGGGAKDPVAAQKKKDKEDAAKALSFSEKSEVTFVVSLLVAIVCLTLLGLCCINYARFFITGKMEPEQRPGQGGPGPGQGPPGAQYERMKP